MAHLLSYLGDLIIHTLLVGGHSIKLGIQLINQLTKNFISLGLRHDATLRETL